MIGETVGRYRIVRRIGEGGMGTVYVAEDPTLDRRIALKVLTVEGGDREERRRRFDVEARAVAALNHPNIVVIHSVESEGDVDFITMELVDGEPLDRLIDGRGLPLDRLFDVAIPLADAIETAHAHGILHRDLKPSNVMVTDAGRVKVLDFGLAKLRTTAADPSAVTAMPVDDLTAQGQILGTVAYMSPEQAEGKAVDERSDLFSLGVILYEMATGVRPFQGGTAISVISSILRDVPPPVTEIDEALPRHLGRIIRRSLEKDPERRYQSAKDLRLELEALRDEIGSGTHAGDTAGIGAAAVGAAAAGGGRRALSRSAAGALVATAAVVSALAGWALMGGRTGESGDRAPLRRLSIVLPEEEPYALWSYPNLAVSPDGERIVYASQVSEETRLYLRRLDRFEAVPIPGTEEAIAPFFSPDGQWVGYFTYDGPRIRKVSLAGGAPVTIADVPDSYGATWGDDGYIYFNLAWGDGFARVPDSGGEIETLIEGHETSGTESGFWPRALPGTGGILHGVWEHGAWRGAFPRLEVYSVADGESRVLLENATHARYVDSGHLIYRSSESMMAVRFDPDRLEIVGAPVPLPEPVAIWAGMGSAEYDVSPNGVMAFIGDSAVDAVSLASLVSLDRDGTSTPIDELAGRFFHARLSPDGTRLAITKAELGKPGEIWIYDLERGTLTPLTSGGGRWAVWTPDGDWVTFNSNREPDPGIYRQRADGTGEAELLLPSVGPLPRARPFDWSPDGKHLLVGNAWADSDILAYPVDDPDEITPVAASGFHESMARFSPDGRWIAYHSSRTDERQVYVQPFPGPGPRTPISTDGGRDPFWSPDGTELFYFMDAGRLMVVAVEAGQGFRAGRPEALFEAAGFRSNLAITPDGESFVGVLNPDTAHSSHINVVLDLRRELQRLLPW